MLKRINDMLVYDTETRIVYWKFAENGTATNDTNDYTDKHSEYKHKVGYMSQYIGPNGKCCHYIDNNIVEV